ncbi:hypothetical protein F4679DRAFT_583697 [Xylaria curta]|nr:hypothetical protein F4679DRAFT_583697 [Xylaria curta]
MSDAEDKAEESEENISPDAEKSEIRFTLQRRRDRNGENDNSGNERDSNRQGRNRGGDDNNQDRRSGRDGDSNGRNSRFRGGGDGPPFFREEKDGGGGKSGDNGDGNGNGDGKGDSRGGGKGDNGGGGNDNNGDGKGDKGRDNNGGNGNGDNNDGGGGNDNGNGGGRGERGGGRGNGGNGGGGGPPGGDRGSNPSSDNTSSSPLPPPPPPPSTTTTVESTTTEEASTTTTSEISTSTPIPEATITTTTSSVLQTNTIPLLTPLPALADTAPTSIGPPILVPTDGPSVPTTILTSASVTDITDSTTLAPTQTNTNPANSSDKGNGRHRGFGDNNKGNDKEGGLNPTSERILVAAGSIGAFIVFLFIGWMVYRTLKKSKQPDHHDKGWLSKLVPFRGRSAESNTKAFGNSYEPKESLPAYDFGNNNSMEAFGYYDQTKFAPFGSEGIMYQSIGTLQNGRVVWQTPEVQQPLQPQASLQSQYPGITDQTVDMSDVNSTMRSRMPGPYYNQSEFARQPSDAYNPAQRQVYRASEISSLSSGFGDGDIIMPPPNIIPKPPTAPVTNNSDTNNRPFSWMSRTASVKKRETVSTTTSEHPTRFRSVNSWVDQQKERLKRANSRTRAREEVPAIPQISYK